MHRIINMGPANQRKITIPFSANFSSEGVEMSMEGVVMRALFNNHSKSLGRAETRIGRDEDYWVEMDEFREGMPALDRVPSRFRHFTTLLGLSKSGDMEMLFVGRQWWTVDAN